MSYEEELMAEGEVVKTCVYGAIDFNVYIVGFLVYMYHPAIGCAQAV